MNIRNNTRETKATYMLPTLDFTKSVDGLVPVVAQDYQTNEILMLAFTNEEAWNYSLKTGYATYWSRSRSALWKKGQSSGHLQKIKEILVDCDKDSVILKVDQLGSAACHEGYKSCFYNRVDGESYTNIGESIFNPEEVYKK
ncbi:MAG: phosphoribosyl-AMP cyclohydrolase [Lentisphaeraceae bacterium]|nr:phosphoribosyl-AMP cyclohydrolase [Lentisphaeraceae bacterium]